jgi:hypothetical protein
MAKNLIFQCWIDEDYKFDNVPEYAEVSKLYVEEYAKKCEADYKFYHDAFFHEYSIFLHTTHEKMRIIYDESLDEYDNVVYVDTDIIPHSQAPNIFDEMKGKGVGVYVENFEKGSFASSCVPWNCEPDSPMESHSTLPHRLFDLNGVAHKIRKQKVNNISWQNNEYIVKWYNTGVMYWSREDRIRAREEWDHFYNFRQLCAKKFVDSDEGWFNVQALKYDWEFNDIPVEWNCMPDFYTPENVPKANLYHFSGSGAKKTLSDPEKFEKFYERYCK